MSDTSVQQIPNRAGKKCRVRLIAVVNPSCTGCEVCVDFCPVDCIDDLPPIRIRVEECIGCQVCAKVCDELTWNAIEMLPVDEFERRFGTHLHDHGVKEKVPLGAPAGAV